MPIIKVKVLPFVQEGWVQNPITACGLVYLMHRFEMRRQAKRDWCPSRMPHGDYAASFITIFSQNPSFFVIPALPECILSGLKKKKVSSEAAVGFAGSRV